jgi:TolA-binding protein
MGKRRNKKKDDEQLIDIIEVKDQTQNFFEENKTKILSIIGLLFLVVVAFLVFKFMIQQPKEKNAKAAIYKAEQQFQRDSFALALENPGGGFEGFLDIIDNYSGTSTANAAKLYAGISYLNLGRYDDAISYLDSHSASGTYAPIIKNGNLGDAYAEKGDLDKAISYYQKASNAGEDALLTPYYLYKLGLLAKRQGQNDKALKAFKEIEDNFPKSEEARKVARLVAELSN